MDPNTCFWIFFSVFERLASTAVWLFSFDKTYVKGICLRAPRFAPRSFISFFLRHLLLTLRTQIAPACLGHSFERESLTCPTKRDLPSEGLNFLRVLSHLIRTEGYVPEVVINTSEAVWRSFNLLRLSRRWFCTRRPVVQYRGSVVSAGGTGDVGARGDRVNSRTSQYLADRSRFPWWCCQEVDRLSPWTETWSSSGLQLLRDSWHGDSGPGKCWLRRGRDDVH